MRVSPSRASAARGAGPHPLLAAALLTVVLCGCAPQHARRDAPLESDLAAAHGALSSADPSAGAETADRASASEPRPASRAAQPSAPARGDVWARIRAGLALEDARRRRIDEEVAWFTRNQTYLERVGQRARRYLPYIAAEVERRELPMELALLPVVESGFQPFAYSPMGASGLWQFMPSTGRRFGLRQTYWYDARRDVIESTRAALDYLETLARAFDGDWLHAVAAYNSGEGNVRRAIRRNARAGKPTDFWALRLPPETRAYVPRLLAIARIVADPAAHGVELVPIGAEQTFAVVPLEGQIDLAVAAQATGVTLDDLYMLNPGLDRWATDPAGPDRLVVPSASAETARGALAALAPEQRMGWERHQIAPGESLGTIARRYRTSIAVLRDANDIDGSMLVAGDDLVVPVAARPPDAYELSGSTRRLMGVRIPSDRVRTVYRVRSGDSLWLIARRHDTTVRALANANGISTRAVLRPGQRLVVWSEAGEDAATPAPRPSRTRAGRYVVQRGDNLWLIARRHAVSVDDLTAWNDLSARATLRPGQSLHVRPVSAALQPEAGRTIAYTVRRGDSLWLIARRFDVSIDALREWNALGRDGRLQPGQSLTIRVEGARDT